MGKKRVAIYAFYDEAGVVDRYVTYMLQALLEVCDRLVVVCNGELTGDGKSTFDSITGDVFTRENEGFDAWGFKAGIEHIGWDELEQYDELVLVNNTVFGPLYPFQVMFDEMDKRKLDFWGITKHGQISDPYGLTNDGIFPEHIQSYFFVVGNKMLSHPTFKSYWDNLPKFKSWKKAVSLHEVMFTRFFAQQGFLWDVYVNTDKGLKGITGTCLLELMTYELLKNYRLPVIKRKNFSTEYDVVIGTTVGDSTKKAFDYIRTNTDYNVDLIWENILRTMPLRTIKDNLDLNYILPHDYIYPYNKRAQSNGRDGAGNHTSTGVALFTHITYEDQLEFCASYAESIMEDADIYVTTESESMRDRLLERFGKMKCNKLEVLLLPSGRKGRDVSALWVALRPYIQDYDYICFTHNKKSSQDKPFTIGRGFAQRCFGNTLASKEYVVNIINLFEDNPRLGMLFPPPVIHGRYNRNISKQWGTNYKKTADLAKKLDINVPIDKKDPVFPAGGMFWFRPKALQKLIDHDWKYDEFPGEPLATDGTLSHAFERLYCFAAQSEGYYSAWVMTVFNASTEITSLNHLLAQWHSPIPYE